MPKTMAMATPVVQSVSRLSDSGPTLRVTWSPTGILTARTRTASSIARPRSRPRAPGGRGQIGPLVLDQGDHRIEEHGGLEDGQAGHHTPADRLLDDQEPNGDHGANT